MAVQGFQHKYPMDIDLGADTFFPETIKFTFNERKGVNFDQVMGSIQDKMKKTSAWQNHMGRR